MLMNWFHWLSFGYWLGSNKENYGNSSSGVGCLGLVAFVLLVEYVLPDWFTKVIVPGLLFEFNPLQIIISIITAGICFFIVRKIQVVIISYIIFFIGISNLFYTVLLLFDSRF